MFNAIIPLAAPIVAVQVEASQLVRPGVSQLWERLEAYFMRPVVLVAWDENSRFMSFGYPCPEDALTNDDLEWRKFELPLEAEIPF